MASFANMHGATESEMRDFGTDINGAQVTNEKWMDQGNLVRSILDWLQERYWYWANKEKTVKTYVPLPIEAMVSGLLRDAHRDGEVWARRFFAKVKKMRWAWHAMSQQEEGAGAYAGCTSTEARKILRAMFLAAGLSEEEVSELVPDEGKLQAMFEAAGSSKEEAREQARTEGTLRTALADHGGSSGQYFLGPNGCGVELDFGAKTKITSEEQIRHIVEEWKKVLRYADKNSIRFIAVLSAFQYLASRVCDVEHLDDVKGRALAIAKQEYYSSEEYLAKREEETYEEHAMRMQFGQVRLITGPRKVFQVELAAGSAKAVETGVDTGEISSGNLLLFEARTGVRLAECKDSGYSSEDLCNFARTLPLDEEDDEEGGEEAAGESA